LRAMLGVEDNVRSREGQYGDGDYFYI